MGMTKQELLKLQIRRQLYFEKQLSSTELSERIGKSLPIVLKILNEMIREGEVRELGYAASTGGRRPMLYALEKNRFLILSVAMDQLYTRICLMNMNNEFAHPVQRVALELKNNDQALNKLEEAIEEYLSAVEEKRGSIIGIGIGMPGFIDVRKGINYSFLKPEHTNICSYLEQKLGISVFLDNDSSLIALAELKFGAARNIRNGMVINVSWGVGLGMIINGELFRGHNGFAGEFSHIPIFTTDKLCSCGKTGCLETEASLLVIAERAKLGLQGGRVSSMNHQQLQPVEEVCENVMQAALRGDKFAVEILSSVGYNIGRGVAILIHLMNPELIVLSGRGARVGKIWLAPIEQAMNEHCIPRLAYNTSLTVSTLGQDAELIGAASLVMESTGTGLTRPATLLNN